MKIMFLDHDGVICLEQQFGSRFNKLKSDNSVDSYFDDFDKKAIKVLNEILLETDVNIVVSSDWKNFADIDELGEYYKLQGIIKTPIDITPYYLDLPITYKLSHKKLLEETRSIEIKYWLEQYPEVTHWVSVDDLDMSIEHLGEKGLTNFVLTPRGREGIKQCNVKKKILKYLK